MNYSSLSSNQVSFNSSRSQDFHQCSHQQLYKKAYNQLSNLRIEFRACQQQTLVLRNTVKGLEQENKYLKGFLNNKKEIISKLNYQINCCNQQINRLEEEANREKDSKIVVQEKYNALKDKEHQTEKLMNQWKRQGSVLKEKLREMELEVRQKQRCLSQKKQVEGQTEALKHICRMIEVSIQGLTNGKAEHISEKTSNFIVSHQEGDNALKQFSLKWNKLTESHKQKLQQLENYSKLQKNQILSLNSSIQSLKTELAEQRQQLTLQKTRYNTLLEMKERQNKEFTAKVSSINKNKEQIIHKLVHQLISALRKCFGQQNSVVLEKILKLATINQPEIFELDILINELWNVVNVRYAVALKHELQSKQVQKINEKYSELQQQYELLTLNHGILQRQYRQLLEDNRRLIKYNNISQFRLRRNVMHQSSVENQQQPASEKATRMQGKLQSFKTHRKDYQKQSITKNTSQSHGSGKENDYMAYNC